MSDTELLAIMRGGGFKGGKGCRLRKGAGKGDRIG